MIRGRQTERDRQGQRKGERQSEGGGGGGIRGRQRDRAEQGQGVQAQRQPRQEFKSAGTCVTFSRFSNEYTNEPRLIARSRVQTGCIHRTDMRT